MRATQSVQGGFLFIVLGLFALIYSGLSGYAGWLVFQKEVIQGQQTEYDFRLLFGQSAIGLFLTVFLTYFGFKLSLKVPPYDTHDPKEPNLKF